MANLKIKRVTGSKEFRIFVDTGSDLVPSRGAPRSFKTKKGASRALRRLKL